MTATSEAMADPDIRALVQKAFNAGRVALTKRLELAAEQGDLPADTNIPVLAQIGSGAFDTLAIRARARVPRAELETIASNIINLICD